MKEADYIKVTNKTNIRRASDCMRDILEGDQYGVSEVDYKIVTAALSRMSDRIFSEIETEE